MDNSENENLSGTNLYRSKYNMNTRSRKDTAKQRRELYYFIVG